MRLFFRAGVWALAGVGAKSMYDKYLADTSASSQLLPDRPVDLRATNRATVLPGLEPAPETDLAGHGA
jgi:hypothetical protein